jgi:hypothetical protein
MQRLHHDDGSPRDPCGFQQQGDGVGRIVKHEAEQRRRKGVFLEWQRSVGDENRARAHDMHVADVGGHHFESELALQPRREMAGPRAEIEQPSLTRQPGTELLDQLAGATFHYGVKERLQHRAPRAPRRP